MRFFALIVVTIMGCFSSPEQQQNDEFRRSREDARKLSYMQDDRTGLCFVYDSLGFNAAILASVPCTPEVLKLLPKPVLERSSQ